MPLEGYELAWLRGDVRRGETELSPARVTVFDAPAQHEGLGRDVVGDVEVASGECRSHGTRTPPRCAEGRRLVDGEAEPLPLGGQQCDVAGAVVPESEVLADHDLSRAQLADDDTLDEVHRRLAREFAVEGEDTNLLDARGSKSLETLVHVPRSRGARSGARTWAGCGSNVTTVARRRRRVARVSTGVDDGLMAAVQPVEHPDGDDRITVVESFDVSPSRTTIM